MSKGKAVLSGTHFMLGDFAAAEGGLAAGCKFFAGYPITPSSEVPMRMSQRMPQIDGEFIQMEDELASMAALCGASLAGTKSMTATSGPGFSLMQENIGLAFMLEAPCVIVNIMRGGPSTGMPTLTSQGDVMQARWGSHGDYDMIAYAPSSVQEMFDFTVKAFNEAERYRTPACVMGDQLLGLMTGKLIIPPEEEMEIVTRKRAAKGLENYLPHDSSELIPPMAYAGDGYRIHTTGLTHDDRGYPSTFANSSRKLLDRLMAKIATNTDKIIELEEYQLDDAELGIVVYGSDARVAKKAVILARKEGIKVGMLRLKTLWPFPAERIKSLGEQVKKIIFPEVNYGQLVWMARAHTSTEVISMIHAGGAIHTPKEILAEIKEAVR
jgi:2-oxoglutarate ferredoxin oxidoreductase subunit alpha